MTKKPKVVGLLIARMGSSRCPGKSLEKLENTTLLGLLLERVRESQSLDEIVLATTELDSDDVLEAFAKENGIGCYRGSSDDVLGRITGAAAAFDADIVLDLLGDNPLIHSELIDDVLSYFLEGGYDLATNATVEFPHAPKDIGKFPVGVRVIAISRQALVRCEEYANSEEHREHSTKFIFDNPDKFKVGYMPADGKWAPLNRGDLTFAVNFQENLDMIAAICVEGFKKQRNFGLHEAMEIFDANPELKKLMGNNF